MSAGTSSALWPENAPDPTYKLVAHIFAISSGKVAAWDVLDDLLSPYLLFMSSILVAFAFGIDPISLLQSRARQED